MARIRTVKPEFWADEKLSPMEAITRLVFLGLISMADDAGRIVDSIKQIDAFIFPFTDESCRRSIDELSSSGRLQRGETASGQRIIQIVNWHHQKIDKPNLKGALPPIRQLLRDNSSIDRRLIDDTSTPLSVPVPVPTTNDLRSPTVGPPAATVDPARGLPPDPVRALLAEHDFGAFAPAVEGICRAARNPDAVMATLRMHIAGELGHEKGSPLEVGLACQQFNAQSEEFNALYFGGFVKRAKASINKVNNRARNAEEDRFIASDRAAGERRQAEDAESAKVVSRFQQDRPDDYEQIRSAAERSVPPTITFGRDIMIDTYIAQQVRQTLNGTAQHA